MKVRLVWLLFLLSSSVAAQNRTIPASRLELTATLPKKVYKAGEPIKVQLKITNRLHDRVRVSRSIKKLHVACAAHTSDNRWVACDLDEGFEVTVYPEGESKPGPSYQGDMVAGDPPTFQNKSLLLFQDDFFGTESEIGTILTPGKYVLDITYHGWVQGKITEANLEFLRAEDAYAPVGDSALPKVVFTVEK